MQEEIYLLEANRGEPSRESVVLKNLVDALRQRLRARDALLQHDECSSHAASYSLPADYSGAFRFKSESKVISAGQEAFVALADYYKSSVFVDDVDLLPNIDADRPSNDYDVVKRVVWSSINTRRLVSLGPSSWRAVQLLEGGARFYFQCPPIRLPSKAVPRADGGCDVVIIAHQQFEDSTAEATAIADALADQLGDRVRTLGFEVSGLQCCEADRFGNAAADIHVHVGCHDAETTQLRVVDSWASGCSVVQQLPDLDQAIQVGGICVDDGANGLRPPSLDQAVSAVISLTQDPFLRRTLNRGGQSMVTTAGREWEQIADTLLG